MTKSEKQLRDALAKIAEVAGQAVGGTTNTSPGSVEEPNDTPADFDPQASCSIRQLPSRLLEKAAKTAVQINPVNAPFLGPAANTLDDSIITPEFLTLLVSKYWGPMPRRLTVSFMEATPTDLKNRILSHMNAWATRECISFALTNGTGQVRISRGAGGFWSYLGTDILQIPANRPTMNLQGFSMATPESEYRRVVRHETGHTLGFPHEHMRQELVNRIDPQKAYAYFLRTQGWSKSMVDAQVLTPLNQASIFGTPADQTSIMCYQLPGSITKNGLPITGGIDINATDYAFAAQIYPKFGAAPASGMPDSATTDEWEPSEDVGNQALEEAIRSTIMLHNSLASSTQDAELDSVDNTHS